MVVCITAVFFFTMQDGKLPIMWAAGHGHRELVEVLFPWTKPIPSIPDWSVDGILRAMKYLHLEVQVCKWFLMGIVHSEKTAVVQFC